MTVAMIAFTRQGAALGKQLSEVLTGSLHLPERLASQMGVPAFESLTCWTELHWNITDALIFIGAAGIAVRAIAPHIQDKFTDPAVVSLDEAGQFIIPLLSGHVGGANALARQIAILTAGQAAISTATDVHGLFAVDQWAMEQNLVLTDRILAKKISAALLDGMLVGFHSDYGHPCPHGLLEGPAQFTIWITCRTGETPNTLRLVPKQLILGIGCRRGTSKESIETAVNAALEGYDLSAVSRVATIDLKQNEVGLLDFCQSHAFPLSVYSAAELNAVEGTFTLSHFVHHVTGVDNVCERAAVLDGGRLLIAKQAGYGVTVALAEKNTI